MAGFALGSVQRALIASKVKLAYNKGVGLAAELRYRLALIPTDHRIDTPSRLRNPSSLSGLICLGSTVFSAVEMAR
jgi:hypothetical protein